MKKFRPELVTRRIGAGASYDHNAREAGRRAGAEVRLKRSAGQLGS